MAAEVDSLDNVSAFVGLGARIISAAEVGSLDNAVEGSIDEVLEEVGVVTVGISSPVVNADERFVGLGEPFTDEGLIAFGGSFAADGLVGLGKGFGDSTLVAAFAQASVRC